MAKTDFSALSDEALVHAELGAERELLAAGFRLRMGNLEDTSSIGKLRRRIAQLRTAQRSRERDQGVLKDSLRGRYASTFVAQASTATGGGASGFVKGLVDKIETKE